MPIQRINIDQSGWVALPDGLAVGFQTGHECGGEWLPPGIVVTVCVGEDEFRFRLPMDQVAELIVSLRQDSEYRFGVVGFRAAMERAEANMKAIGGPRD